MSSSKVLLGFVAGAAVGALAGILFAPDKGSNTRKKIADKTGDISDSVKKSFSDFIDTVKDTYSGAKNEAEDLAENVKVKMNNLQNEAKNTFS